MRPPHNHRRRAIASGQRQRRRLQRARLPPKLLPRQTRHEQRARRSDGRTRESQNEKILRRATGPGRTRSILRGRAGGSRSGRLLSTLERVLEETHANQPKYKPNKHVYPWVDLQPNMKLRSIYSGMEYNPEELIQRRLSYRSGARGRLQEKMLTESSLFGAERMEEELDLLEAVCHSTANT